MFRVYIHLGYIILKKDDVNQIFSWGYWKIYVEVFNNQFFFAWSLLYVSNSLMNLFLKKWQHYCFNHDWIILISTNKKFEICIRYFYYKKKYQPIKKEIKMASGNCPRCGIYAEIFKCKYCGDVRCGSTNTKYDNPKNPQKDVVYKDKALIIRVIVGLVVKWLPMNEFN